MPMKKQEPPRGPMIHIRLDETTHRKLKIRVANDGTTIQHLVADLIRREVGESDRSKKTKLSDILRCSTTEPPHSGVV